MSVRASVTAALRGVKGENMLWMQLRLSPVGFTTLSSSDWEYRVIWRWGQISDWARYVHEFEVSSGVALTWCKALVPREQQHTAGVCPRR